MTRKQMINHAAESVSTKFILDGRKMQTGHIRPAYDSQCFFKKDTMCSKNIFTCGESSIPLIPLTILSRNFDLSALLKSDRLTDAICIKHPSA
jgi:hypothetical protein